MAATMFYILQKKILFEKLHIFQRSTTTQNLRPYTKCHSHLSSHNHHAGIIDDGKLKATKMG
jgi:hypothetical protein